MQLQTLLYTMVSWLQDTLVQYWQELVGVAKQYLIEFLPFCKMEPILILV